MTKSDDKSIGGDYVALYNDLHKKISAMAKPHFQDVAAGLKKDRNTTSDTAEGFIDSNHIPFMKAVHVAKRSNNFINERVTELYKIHELRNLIVHDHNGKSDVIDIAHPSPHSFDLLNETLDKLNYSMTVSGFLKKHRKQKVQTVQLNTNIYDLFHLIKDTSFTQFPVFDKQKFQGLVSDNGITFKLSQFALEEKEFETLELSGITVSDLIHLDEQRNQYKVISSDVYLYDVLPEFKISPNKQSSPILLIQSSESIGKELTPNSLIGILTTYDYLDIYREAITEISV